MIEQDEVETLIVKDMSRLGREYLQVGQLTELYLPAKGVRFIAINDGVERGERLSGMPPYGYRKRSSDTKAIVPDEDTAPVVQRIFELCTSGKGPNQIARILTNENVVNPSNY